MSAMLRGAPNFRDLGGLRTADGGTVRPGRLLRSGHLGGLDAEDVAALSAQVGPDVWVIDLRGDAERARIGCALPGAVVHALPIEPTVARKLDALAAAGQPMTPETARRFMREAYENFVRHAHAQLAGVFEHAITRAGKPLLVHCAQGKDRTGFMIAMLLAALGVPRDSIMEDYLLTNQRLTARDSGCYPAQVMQVLGSVHAEYMDSAFALVDGEFGGLEAFLEHAAALGPARRAALRRALVTP